MKVFEYIVVGSGCAGSMAAQTLVEAGVEVAMLDVGFENKSSASIKDDSFINLRKNDKDQYKYLIGENGEGLQFGSLSKGAQVTPPRAYMTSHTEKYIPLDSSTFSPIESLGYGGLGISWGLQCWEFSDADMRRAGLNSSKMQEAYETVSKRIGISGADDAASSYTLGKLKTYQKAANTDRVHSRIYDRYEKNAKKFSEKGLYVGRTPLALTTEDFNDRKGYGYQDMDFYTNLGESAWRPWVTVNRLKKARNFTYIGSHLVLRFFEKDNVVNIVTLNVKTNEEIVFQTKKLILASGALGSARIILRSQPKDRGNAKLPILSNPHTYLMGLQLSSLGSGEEVNKLSLGQLSYFIDPNKTDEGLSVATSYSYQSLMLLRLITQTPINFADARIILRYLSSALVLFIVQHPDQVSPTKYLELKQDSLSPTKDKLSATYEPTAKESKNWKESEQSYIKALRKLGVQTLRNVHAPHGSAVHYAGTIPFDSGGQSGLTLSSSGKLNGTKNVYVADSSGFNYLPAKGLTFSLMANSHIISTNALKGR